MVAQLTELAQLCGSGRLGDAEFAVAKAEPLSRMGLFAWHGQLADDRASGLESAGCSHQE